MPRPVLIILIVIAAIIVLAGVGAGISYAITRPAGPIVAEERQVADFTEVEIRGSGTLIITQGAEPSLVVEAKRRVLDRIETTVTGNKLILDLDWNWYAPWLLCGSGDIVYRLTVTDLTRIEADGASDIQASQALLVDALELAASGASEAHLELACRTVRVRTSGAAEITLSGSADTLEFISSGAASLHSRELQARVATIDCSGAAEVEVNVSEQLDVDISGAGEVSYMGDPNVTSNISGAGEVERLR